jgi:hypothetical protein
VKLLFQLIAPSPQWVEYIASLPPTLRGAPLALRRTHNNDDGGAAAANGGDVDIGGDDSGCGGDEDTLCGAWLALATNGHFAASYTHPRDEVWRRIVEPIVRPWVSHLRNNDENNNNDDDNNDNNKSKNNDDNDLHALWRRAFYLAVSRVHARNGVVPVVDLLMGTGR